MSPTEYGAAPGNVLRIEAMPKEGMLPLSLVTLVDTDKNRLLSHGLFYKNRPVVIERCDEYVQNLNGRWFPQKWSNTRYIPDGDQNIIIFQESYTLLCPEIDVSSLATKPDEIAIICDSSDTQK